MSAASEPQKSRCSLPGDSDSGHSRDDDVEIPVAQSGSRIGHRRRVRTVDGDAEPLERRLVEQDRRARSSDRRSRNSTLERLAGLDVDQLLVAHLVARLAQQPQSPRADWRAPLSGVPSDRIGVGRGEHFRRHLVAHGLQDFELLALRQPGGGELGAVEIAVDALVLAEEDLLVHLLEIEGEVERAPHARVLELVAPRVEGEGLHDSPIAHRKLLEQDALFLDRREIVGRRPVLGAVLGAPVELVGLERFERDRRDRGNTRSAARRNCRDRY